MIDKITVVESDLPSCIAGELESSRAIACDIETSGLDWRNDEIGTCQLFAPAAGTVVVKAKKGVPLNLKSLLESNSVEKVFHHAPFDLRFMLFHWGIHARSVTCTKVASRLISPDWDNEKHSLKPLLFHYLNICVDKSEQRSSWTDTHLTDAQLVYAAEDVRYLISLKECLEREIVNKGLEVLYRDCLSFLPSRIELEVGGWPDVFKY